MQCVTDISRFRVAEVLLLANRVILRIYHFPLVDSLIECGCLKVQEEKQI